jgi:hypothetical protein
LAGKPSEVSAVGIRDFKKAFEGAEDEVKKIYV